MTGAPDPEAAAAPAPVDLRDQVAVVIGGAGGIGLAIARELDRRGSLVVVASRDAERVERAAASLARGVGFPGCDVRLRACVDALFDFVERRFARLDVLVLCAGIGRGSRGASGPPPVVAQLGEDEWDEVIDTNLRGTFMASRAAARWMIRQRSGQILNISSARGALRGQPCGAGYCASKMGARAMFESLAAELAPFGVRAMSLLPDAVDTSLIAGTTLAPRGALQPERVGRLVGELLAMPRDAVLENPRIAALGPAAQHARRELRRA